jgi:protein-tyrosine phosphatase
MRLLAAALAFSCALLPLAACDDGPDSTEQNLTQTLTLRFQTKDGAIELKSSGKLLTCTQRFEGIDGERVTCARTGEKVQVIVKSSGDSVVAVRDMGGKRGYYACTPSGDVQGLPTQMKCKITTIKPRGSGGLTSPFDSTVEGVEVPNTHWVDADRTVMRGMEPRTPADFEQLRGAGVERVVIFKNMTGNADVGEEIEAWDLPDGDVLHVPFKWKDLDGFKATCEQTVEALRFLKESGAAKEKVFFHCTVGEDRTGYLAALYSMLFEGAEAQAAFDADMCERGYGSGNPQKPGFVLGKLEDGLTPMYRSMAFLIDQGILTKDLNDAACATEPDVDDDFLSETLVCGVSTTLVP